MSDDTMKQAEDLYREGVVLAGHGRYEEALAAFEQSIQLDPSYSRSWYGKGNVLFDCGRHEDALAAYEQSILLDPKASAPWNGKGNVLADSGRHEEALASYEESIRLDPNDAIPWHGKGNALDLLGRHEEALTAFEESIRLDPEFANPWNDMGVTLDSLGRHENALASYNESIRLDPKDALHWNGKGNALHSLGRHGEALAAYEEGIRLDPKNTNSWNGKGNALNSLGRHEEALTAFEESIRQDPKNSCPWNGKGNTLITLGRHEDALVAFEESIRRDPKDTLPWNGKGNALDCLGLHDEALASFEESIRLDPKNSNPWNGKGLAFNLLGRHEEALDAYEQSIRLDPKDALPWNGKGNTLNFLGWHGEALASYEQSIRLDPMFSDPWYGKGFSLSYFGRHEEALVAFEESIRLDPKIAAPCFGKGIVYAACPPLELATGESHGQCFNRAAHLLLGATRRDGRMATHLLKRFRDDVSLPLIASRLLAAYPFASQTVSYGAFLSDTLLQCAPAFKMLSLLESATDISPVEKSLWKGIVCYYHGDAPQAREHLDEVDSADEGNLMGQWYLLESLRAYLEPCDQEKAFALKKASLLLDQLDAGKSVEQAYYAGHILLQSGETEKAFGCFSHGCNHLPSLYMRWLHLHETKDSAANECLEIILKAEYELLLQGKCGFLLPQQPPKIDPTQPGWLDDMQFYIHFREVDGAAMEIARLDNLEDLCPTYRKLFPDTTKRLWGERDAYLDKARTFQFKAEAEKAYTEAQRKRTDDTASNLLGEIRSWLEMIGLQESLGTDQMEAASSVGEAILKSNLSKKRTPFDKVIDYYFLRREISAEDAVFLHFYHALKLHDDGCGGTGSSRMIWAGEYAKAALSPLVGLIASIRGERELGALLAVALGLVPLLVKQHRENDKEQSALRPFPSFLRFKQEFYELETEIGGRDTLEKGVPETSIP